MFILYRTDVWHTYKSRDLIAVCTTQKHLIKICKTIAQNDNTKLSEDDMYCLNYLKQTQGYTGTGELVYEEIKQNTIL
ncbi:MAG: hypothetical protein QM763_04275 [Agriterribacter sp.]